MFLLVYNLVLCEFHSRSLGGVTSTFAVNYAGIYFFIVLLIFKLVKKKPMADEGQLPLI